MVSKKPDGSNNLLKRFFGKITPNTARILSCGIKNKKEQSKPLSPNRNFFNCKIAETLIKKHDQKLP